MRARLAILIVWAMIIAFAQAPFVHTHRHEETQKHSGALVHTHFQRSCPVAAGQQEFRALNPEDDAQLQDWFSALGGGIDQTPVIITSIFTIPPLNPTPWTLAPPCPQGHDPPFADQQPARAPPA